MAAALAAAWTAPAHRSQDVTALRRQSLKTRDVLAVAGQEVARAVSPPLWYDDFAIGWNELFDQAPGPAGGSGTAGPPSVRQPPRRPAPTDETATGQPLWAAEAPSSQRLPDYLQLVVGRQSAIDRRMKEQMLQCHPSQLRRPAEVVEGQLAQMRAALLEQQRARRKEARQLRRLQRRCRVKGHEDLATLEATYLADGPLQPLEDPGQRALRQPLCRAAPAKAFFRALSARRHPSEPPTQLALLEAPYTAR